MLAHNVYFSLKDNSDLAKQKFVEACKKFLLTQSGLVFSAVGTVANERRPVNDLDFDVSLHIVFPDQAAHDRYQDHPLHQQFITEHMPSWRRVRVFDSIV